MPRRNSDKEVLYSKINSFKILEVRALLFDRSGISNVQRMRKRVLKN